MSDIFREVDEGLRRDRYGRLWKRFAPYIIGVAVLIVVGTGGYRYWEYRQAQESAKAGDILLSAIDAGNAGDHDTARQELAGLSYSTGGYPVLARMRTASEMASAGDKESALKAFSEIADDTKIDNQFRDIAEIRAGYLAVDLENRDQVKARVERLGDAANALRAAAWEILGLAAWKANNMDGADKCFSMILDDQQAPADVNTRARMMQSLIQAAKTPEVASNDADTASDKEKAQ
ncbi:tetratricopeptide repeat protein [Breoghania sp.]|uniref:tetratricopeptide repeat protein n=1 Tax=Breoghania sp. TaxID=2065378 RepID=UPI00262FA1EE|nr:tetratricopeptide repeat protein [Breoghania sp.]MDJ0930854.1 tetratricopeptide repeat protein [Breoghania sp.]